MDDDLTTRLVDSRAFGTTDISARRIAFAIATYERTLVANQTPWDAFIAGNATAMTPNQIQGWNNFNSPGAHCSTTWPSR